MEALLVDITNTFQGRGETVKEFEMIELDESATYKSPFAHGPFKGAKTHPLKPGWRYQATVSEL